MDQIIIDCYFREGKSYIFTVVVAFARLEVKPAASVERNAKPDVW